MDYFVVFLFYREVKRICTVTLSPIYEHFTETLNGLMTIRAFRESHRFTTENEKKLDCNQRANYAGILLYVNLLNWNLEKIFYYYSVINIVMF